MGSEHIQTYGSRLDGQERPYAVCSTGSRTALKPMIVEVSPGGDDLERAVRTVEQLVRLGANHGEDLVALRPTGRGPGSVYQLYGEVDVLEAIEDAVERYGVDRDRIYVTGGSMGGAATFYLVSHHPDLFAAGAPFCGYCDYRLWSKPGGWTYHMHEWEEPSWIARSAVFHIENFAHTPLWMVHGEWDRPVGGGVHVEHSRQMARLLEEHRITYRYTEVPQTGHSCRSDSLFEEVVGWLLRQKKDRSPLRVMHTTHELRHNRSHGITIDQLRRYGGVRAAVEAERAADGSVTVVTDNVRTFSISSGEGPSWGAELFTVDGQRLPAAGAELMQFRLGENGTWSAGRWDLSGEKHRGCAGPMGDLFQENLIIVPGGGDSPALNEAGAINAYCARQIPRHFRSRNGGVHRGGIMGQTHVDLTVVDDRDLEEGQRISNNLLLLGTFATNRVLERYRSCLPLQFDSGSVTLAGRTFEGQEVAVFALFPHPENDTRYIAVQGGTRPDAVTWGSHLDLALLPDYLVYSRDRVLQWGFWGNDWQFQDRA